MAQSIWELNLKGDILSGLSKLEQQVASAFSSMTEHEKQFEAQVHNAGAAFSSQASHVKSSAYSMSGALMHVGEMVAAAFAVEKVVEFGKKVLEVTAEFQGYENRIKFASLDPADAAANIEFLNKEVTNLHLPIQQVNEGFSEMESGLMGTGIEGAKLRELFHGISEAAATVHLNAASMQGTLLAVKEIGEVGLNMRLEKMLIRDLPGVGNAVKKAFGKSMHELAEEGMTGPQFLSKLGPALDQYYKSGIESWSHSLQASMNDTATAMYKKQVEIGTKLEEFYLDIMTHMRGAIYSAGDAFLRAIDWMKAHKSMLENIWEVVKVVGSAYIAYNGILMLTKGYTIALGLAQGILATAQVLLTGANWEAAASWWGLDAAMAGVNIRAGILSAAIAIYLDHASKVRLANGELVGTFQYLEDVIYSVKTAFFTFWEGVKDVFNGIVNLDWSQLKLGGREMKEGMFQGHLNSADMNYPSAGKKGLAEIKGGAASGYNAAATGEKEADKKGEGSNHRSVTVTIHKIVGIEHVHVGKVEDAGPVAAGHITTSLIGGVRDFETGIAADR